MRILVIGGAGYVGSHTVRLLARSGHEAAFSVAARERGGDSSRIESRRILRQTDLCSLTILYFLLDTPTESG